MLGRLQGRFFDYYVIKFGDNQDFEVLGICSLILAKSSRKLRSKHSLAGCFDIKFGILKSFQKFYRNTITSPYLYDLFGKPASFIAPVALSASKSKQSILNISNRSVGRCFEKKMTLLTNCSIQSQLLMALIQFQRTFFYLDCFSPAYISLLKSNNQPY